MDIYLDPASHDILLTNKSMRLVESREEATRQKLAITLKAFKGEWIFNINYGVPYLANDNNKIQLLGKNAKDILDLEIKRAILKTSGVIGIENYFSEEDKIKRKVTINTTVTTEDGDIHLSTII